MGLFDRLKKSLEKTRSIFTKKVDETFTKSDKIYNGLYEELEEALILADVGVYYAEEIVLSLKKNIKQKKIKYTSEAKEELISIISSDLSGNKDIDYNSPTIILMLGINGVGKTTTIAKLANKIKQKNKSVVIAAADTFRAAAIDQLEIWAKKIDCPIIKHSQNCDPGAVIFDSISYAKKRNIDFVICDTAGRLHTKKNLMNEIKKISTIIEKEGEGYSKEMLLVIDATTGQNGLSQAKNFKESCNLTGIILSKLDGTAKGGIVIPIKKELNLPIKFIGIGEKIDDMEPFNPTEFTKAIFN